MSIDEEELSEVIKTDLDKMGQLTTKNKGELKKRKRRTFTLDSSTLDPEYEKKIHLLEESLAEIKLKYEIIRLKKMFDVNNENEPKFLTYILKRISEKNISQLREFLGDKLNEFIQ